ncbi:hypothetical protein KX729_01105 [Rhizobium sp. XQZ8]|uniref:hypothetical protein n=1 Tax=Rhizobium populisoli TaxID=2859785 RepID=UPI001CA5CC99|nr:hypothetical protein [Rhizobium populisoli]MBW6420036.1 hypothetical protein [Rhizobium populisoli]
MVRHLMCMISAAALSLSGDMTAAADADLSKIRKAGSYVILSDKGGKAITGGYWLSPDLKIVIHSEDDASPALVTYVDRELFPRRMAQFDMFINVQFAYEPDPVSLPVGKVAQIRQTSRFSSSQETKPFAFTTISVVQSKLQDIDIVSRHYGVDGDWFGIPDRDAGQRVYIETLDADLSAADAAEVAAIETGEARSTADFQALYFTRAVPHLPMVVKCFEEMRAKPDFQAAAKKQRETGDQWMATIYATGGKTWTERDGFTRADFGPDLSACPDPG